MPALGRRGPMVKIVSNGRKDIHLFDVETGQEIFKNCVRSVTWTMDSNGMARATIELIMVSVEVEAPLPELELVARRIMRTKEVETIEVGGNAEEQLARILQEIPQEEAKKIRSCNIHKDCDAAAEKNEKEYPGTHIQCCHDETCEDCFGS